MFNPVYLVAFSGHRPDGSPGRTDEALENTAPLLRQVLESLQAMVQKAGGDLHLISGAAAGADIVACEVAQAMGLPLHLILPKPEDEFLHSFQSELAAWRPRARALLDATRPGAHGPTSNPRNTFRIGAVSRNSPDCYAEANTHMLESADLLLTVSTGQPPKSIAGTEHLIEEAEARKVPQINIDPSKFNQAPKKRHLSDFANKHCPSLAVFKDLASHVSCDLGTASSMFGSVASCLSKAANKSSASFRRGTAIAISLHAVAGFIAAGAAAFYYALHLDTFDRHVAYWILAALALIELALVGSAFFLEIKSKKAKDQHTWLHCRFAREVMRGIETANLFQDPLFPDLIRHYPQWGRFAITCGLQIRSETGPLDVTSTEALLKARDAYLIRRISDQLNHFKEKVREAHLTSLIFNKLAHYAGPTALAVVFIAFLSKSDDLFFHGRHKPGLLENHFGAAIILLFLPIFVPLLASLSASFLAAFDFGRRSVRYAEMVKTLELAEQKLPKLHALRTIQNSIHHTEQVLLHEQIEWLTAQKSGFGH